MKTIIISFLILSFLQAQSQECRTVAIYKTSSANEILDSVQLKMVLYFSITADSIIASARKDGKNEFMSFKILSKQCFQNKSMFIEKVVYKTVLYDSRGILYPVLTLNLADSSKRYIEVFYENKRARFFPIEGD